MLDDRPDVLDSEIPEPFHWEQLDPAWRLFNEPDPDTEEALERAYLDFLQDAEEFFDDDV